MGLKTFKVTFDNGQERFGTGYDPIGAICTAVKVANAEAVVQFNGESPDEPIVKVNSRNVVRVERVGS